MQNAFAGPGAVGKDFKDKAGAVQQFDPPFLFQIALLHRTHDAIHQNQSHLQFLEPRLKLLDLARPEQGAGLDLVQPCDFGTDNGQAGQSGSQGHGLGQTMFCKAALSRGLHVRMQDISAGQSGRCVMQNRPAAWQVKIVIIVGVIVGQVRDYSSPSYRLIGPPGMMVEIACL